MRSGRVAFSWLSTPRCHTLTSWSNSNWGKSPAATRKASNFYFLKINIEKNCSKTNIYFHSFIKFRCLKFDVVPGKENIKTEFRSNFSSNDWLFPKT